MGNVSQPGKTVNETNLTFFFQGDIGGFHKSIYNMFVLYVLYVVFIEAE